MAVATYTKFNLFTDDLVKGIHNFGSNTFNIALFATAPVITNHVWTDLTGEASGGAYVSGGSASAITVANASGTETVTATSVTWTAASTAMGPFRYAVLYNASATNKNLVCFWDYSQNVTLQVGESFEVEPNSSPTTGTLYTLT
jgi:hypothetical protein